jgi:electron transfer flavoprotein alpha subunit
MPETFLNYQHTEDKVLKVSNDKLAGFTAKAYADVIKQAADKESAKLVLLIYR